MDNLTGVAVFVKVVQERSFSAAADRLNLSKSTVSKQVRALEDRLGAQLLNRTTRRLNLTEVGEAFFERCAQVLADVEEAELAVSRMQSTPKGRLRISAPMSFGQSYLADALAKFMKDHPDIEVEYTLNDQIIDLIDEGFDLAIRVADLPDSSLIARRIAPARLTLCSSPAYLAARGTPAHPRELSDHDCTSYAYHAAGNVWDFEGPDGKHSVRTGGRFRANNGDAMARVLASGVGIGLLPTFILKPYLQNGSLLPILDGYRVKPAGIYAVYPPNRHLSAKVRSFVDFLVQHFGEEPEWDRLARTEYPQPAAAVG